MDRELAKASQDAYSKPATFEADFDVYCCMSEFLGVKLFAFRGSLTVGDWIRDFAAIPTDDANLGICHFGFLNGAQAAAKQISSILQPGEKWIVTGHSLGGALAINTAALMSVFGHPPEYVSTFGAPATSMGSKIEGILSNIGGCRYRFGKDIVPTLPPYPFIHDRDLVEIGSSTNEFSDHSISNYVGAL